MLFARSVFRSQVRPVQWGSCCSYSSSSSAASAEADRTIREGPRNDWTKDEINAVYDSPVLDLLFHGVIFLLTLLLLLLCLVEIWGKKESNFLDLARNLTIEPKFDEYGPVFDKNADFFSHIEIRL